MLVLGTHIHVVTFIFIMLEAGMFMFQLFYYLFRPQETNRLLYLILLTFLLIFNIANGLFPDPRIGIPVETQMMIAYGSGFLTGSYFPYYFYKACDLIELRWHAYFGAPLFLILPYQIFFVTIYIINGNLQRNIIYGMIVPCIYAIVLLWVTLKAIRRKQREERNNHRYVEELAMYCAVTPWASLTFFGLVESSQVTEVLCTNTGILGITFLFIWQSIKDTRREYQRLLTFARSDAKNIIFNEMCAFYRLTNREIEIVMLVQEALTYKQIAEKLFIAEKTVDNHLQHIYEKTGATNKVSLLHKLHL